MRSCTETDLPDRAGKTRACLTAGPNRPEHKKTDTPASRDALRHKSAQRRSLEAGRRASRKALPRAA
ncbi:DUF1534 domain-containing protein [Pseudomonas savastanoi pv. phaseolicola]|nr:DUF1534 domain-containing protein [Pseudomonas savastanoi pv. phaseolicola]MBN3478681.1 DUF1534 domain-containing protein [Pseudomonas savastanoi pv. phaseolicola]